MMQMNGSAFELEPIVYQPPVLQEPRLEIDGCFYNLSSLTNGGSDGLRADGTQPFVRMRDPFVVVSMGDRSDYMRGIELSDLERINSIAESIAANLSLASATHTKEVAASFMDGFGSFILIVFLVSLAIFTIIGNSLVLIAVGRYRYLRSVTNYFIVSLACADLIIGVIVMPFSIALLVTSDRWLFGDVWCNMWQSFDVLASTASILNLCAISLDRYIAVTNAVAYPVKMTTEKALRWISLVWFCSTIISFPAIVWWRATGMSKSENIQSSSCNFTSDPYYLVISSLVSFYIPLFIMVCVYTRVYQKAVRQSKGLSSGQKVTRQGYTLRMHRGGGMSGIEPSIASDSRADQQALITSTTTAKSTSRCSSREPGQSQSIQVTPNPMMVAGSLERRTICPSPVVNSSGSPADVDMISTTADVNANHMTSLNRGQQSISSPGPSSSATTPLPFRSRTTAVENDSSPDPGRSTALKVSAISSNQGAQAFETIVDVAELGYLRKYRWEDLNMSQQLDCAAIESLPPPPVVPRLIDLKSNGGDCIAQMSSPEREYCNEAQGYFQPAEKLQHLHYPELRLKDVQSHRNLLQLCYGRLRHQIRRCLRCAATAGRTDNSDGSDSSNGEVNDDKDVATKMLARLRSHRLVQPLLRRLTLPRKWRNFAREHKAAKTLGIIMGIFILCWLPFFVLNTLQALCGKRCIYRADVIMPLVTWLGYLNSAINPLIYAHSMKDFRRAFARLLCYGCFLLNRHRSSRASRASEFITGRQFYRSAMTSSNNRAWPSTAITSSVLTTTSKPGSANRRFRRTDTGQKQPIYV